MEYLRDVLIKESTPQGKDKVFIVHNLPKNLIYTKQVKMVPKRDAEGYLTGDSVPDPKGMKEECLLDGLKISKHDGAIVFNIKRRHVQTALDNIDRYIDRMFPRDMHPPTRIDYAEKPGDMRSNPLPKYKLPVVEIPLPEGITVDKGQVSPISQDIPVPSTVNNMSIEDIKKQAVEDYKKKKSNESLVKARAARAAKKIK